ncbi:MAG: hypothetical protein U0Q11_00210 [Vicinamibacterales bacterium]
MEITEQEIRAMIRGAIARHQSGHHPVDLAPTAPSPAPATGLRQHGSHALFVVASVSDGECVIEPSQPCDHCGYCKSLGH